MMNSLPAIVTDKLPGYLIQKLIMFNCHPCAARLKQGFEDEYKDEARECAIIGRRVVFTDSIRNASKQLYHYSEQVLSCYMHKEI